jgi:thiol-disulfide isomerase/thioredoxin
MRGASQRVVGLVAVSVLALTGCSEVPSPDSRIDVDSPELVRAKGVAGIDDCTPASGVHVDGGMPSLTLPCLGGGPDVDVAALRGPMLVSLWAYWCQPCRDEIPVLQEFYDDHGDQVSLLGIDYLDAQPGGAIALMDELSATFPSLADPYGELSARKPLPVINGLPHLLFIAADGTIAYHHIGDVTSQRELVDLVDEHLGVKL